MVELGALGSLGHPTFVNPINGRFAALIAKSAEMKVSCRAWSCRVVLQVVVLQGNARHANNSSSSQGSAPVMNMNCCIVCVL
mmetsp:Transcript_10143/g.24147  ORF Transcript_10143/g.24147 Transcript_10143/m.24147 type:complete len:82 (+) Transcript_10143:397-642(+)